MGFIRNIMQAASFLSADKATKRFTFYSEGKVYWVHLEGLVKQLLESGEAVSYISSGDDDPGLQLQHPNYSVYHTDESWIRNWLFENLNCELLIMTMPDLGQYQIKRSRNAVHYVYVQHSLVSLHMVYRPGAFDDFDTVFCAGPHHLEEVRALEKQRNSKVKNIVEHGYPRLDSIIRNAEKKKLDKPEDTPIHVLLAPSWGENSITDLVLEPVLETLLNAGFKVTFRPHPQSLKFSKAIIDKALQRFEQSPLFNFDNNVASETALHDSDVMVCDWSGAALDYAFGLQKPVVSIDVPRKVNNPEYTDVNITPFEVDVRHRIGEVIAMDALDELVDSLNDWHLRCQNGECQFQESGHVFNVVNSDTVGAKELRKLLDTQ